MKIALLITLLSIVPAENELSTILPAVTVRTLREQVPASGMASGVTVINDVAIKNNGIFGQKGLSAMVPGLHMPDYGASLTSTVYIRGLGSRMENPVMGLYIDGIPVLDKNAYDFDWEGISSATMLRGPQGTLYGRNSMGGVLSLRTVSPLETAESYVKAEYGTANTARVGLLFVLGNNAVSLTYRHTDGFFNNAYKGKLCDPYDGLSMRWKWEVCSSERIILSNTLQANISKEGGFAYGLWQDGSLHPVSYNDEGSYGRLSVIEGFRLNHYGDKLKTDITTSLQLLSDDMRMDQDYTPRSVFTLQQKQLSGAATFEAGIRRTDGDAVWQPQTGVFGFYRLNQTKAPVIFKRDGIQSLILDNANSHIPASIGELQIQDETMPVNSDFMIDTWDLAVFHESVFKLERWLLTAGFRIDYEGSNMEYDCLSRFHYRLYPLGSGYSELKVPYAGVSNHHNLELIPKLSALYKAGSRLSFYATVSKGFRAGGFNTQIFSDILQNKTMNATMEDCGVHLENQFVSVSAKDTKYDPETAWNYEIGTRILSGTFSAEASAYYIDVTNQQITVFPPGKSTGRMMTNAGRSRSYGVETQLSWDPGRLRTHVAWSWCDSRFVEFNDGNNDYSGNRVPYVPSHTLHVGAGYSFDLDGKTLELDASLRGTGPLSWNEAGSWTEPFRLTADCRAAFVFPRLELFVRGENITNTCGHSFYFKSMGNEFFASMKPRVVMTGFIFKL